jgi:hypothetical protein
MFDLNAKNSHAIFNKLKDWHESRVLRVLLKFRALAEKGMRGRQCRHTHTQTIVHAIAAPGVIIHFLLAVCVYALLTLRDSSIIHAQSKQVPNTLPASLSRLDRGQSRRQVPCARLSLHTPCIPRRSCSSPDKSTASQGMMVCAINPRP